MHHATVSHIQHPPPQGSSCLEGAGEEQITYRLFNFTYSKICSQASFTQTKMDSPTAASIGPKQTSFLLHSCSTQTKRLPPHFVLPWNSIDTFFSHGHSSLLLFLICQHFHKTKWQFVQLHFYFFATKALKYCNKATECLKY